MVCLAAQDVITGVVSDSGRGSPISDVVVSSEGIMQTTDTAGAFTLSIPITGTIVFQPPRYMPGLVWHPENGSFTWNGYSRSVWIKVHSLQGSMIAQAVFDKGSSASFSLANLPQGTYVVSIETTMGVLTCTVHRIKLGRFNSFSLLSQSFMANSRESAAAAGTGKAHDLLFVKAGFDTVKVTVPAGTVNSIAVKMKPNGKPLKIFDGKSFDGWIVKPSGCWRINSTNESMQNNGTSSFVVTRKKYALYRVSFLVKKGSGTHYPCTLFLGTDTTKEACAAIQIMIPDGSGGWDYRPGKGGELICRTWTPPQFDWSKFVEAEAVVNTAEGWVDAGIAYPPGSKGKKTIRFFDNTIKRYGPTHFGFQCHGGDDPNDEYKDIFIEENPTDDSLQITKRPN